MKLTCPWCGYAEIERPIEGLADCEVCGAEEIAPAELDSEPRQKGGWRESDKVKPYNAEKHGPLRERYFAIICGDRYEAYTESGRLVQLPEDHQMVKNCKGYYEAQRASRLQGEERIKALQG